MKKYRITFDRRLCIGSLHCVEASPKVWKASEDGKAELHKAKEIRSGLFEAIVSEESIENHLLAMKICPVGAIRIEKT